MEENILTQENLIDEIRSFSKKIRASEYHITNACNIRCKGCWFFEYEHEKNWEDKKLENWIAFIQNEKNRGITAPLLIGGEPVLFEERILEFCKEMPYVSISTNGIKPLSDNSHFENLNIFISVFGGGKLDDELRGIKPNGKKFSGLLDSTLQYYKNDDRVNFVYAVTEDGVDYVEETVEKIIDNKNVLTFNYYTDYSNKNNILFQEKNSKLLEVLKKLKEKYPNKINSSIEHIEAIVTGTSWLGNFNYESCPSISYEHISNQENINNGKSHLPFFNTYKSDLKTIEFCCTSGHCDECRDSQAVYS